MSTSIVKAWLNAIFEGMLMTLGRASAPVMNGGFKYSTRNSLHTRYKLDFALASQDNGHEPGVCGTIYDHGIRIRTRKQNVSDNVSEKFMASFDR
jgi:hypothetical protein